MKWLPVCLLAGLSLWPSALRAEFRNWTNADGKNVDAELIKVDDDNVTFRLRNGNTTVYPQAKLSAADREYITKNPPSAPAAKPGTAEKSPPEAGSPTVDDKRKAKWLTKMSKARDEAKETGLPILVLFTGTSWCPYCIKLEAQVFAKKDFTAFANKNLVLLKLDFGPGGSTNNKEQKKLQEDFGVKGFPTYFLTAADGTRLAQGGYNDGITPESFAAWVKSAAAKPE
ncbi:MAG: thioredoxin family protein [Verrucomicrobia bacterium]|nr:thioredoxin family protein [Verrucomicrobiota bacterium]